MKDMGSADIISDGTGELGQTGVNGEVDLQK
jgi:hypothetical protein